MFFYWRIATSKQHPVNFQGGHLLEIGESLINNLISPVAQNLDINRFVMEFSCILFYKSQATANFGAKERKLA